MEIFNIIVRLLISIETILIIPGIIVGIVLLFISRSETDPVSKASKKKFMKWSFFGPIGLLVFTVIIWGLIVMISVSIGQ
jgi:uncharacterized integral membrane protein